MTAGPASARRVLVVEDDPDLSEFLALRLRAEGYAVEAVDSIFGVADLIRRSRPDVILLDLALPYRSGASLLEALKADPATAGIPVVVVSAMAEMLGPRRRALAHAVIAKPFKTTAVLEAVAGARRA